MTNGPAVLVVEDDRNLNRTLSMALKAAGYHTVDAATGQRAIEEVRTRNPDLVLLDLGLPDVDGLVLVPLIRANSSAPIIVLSGRREDTEKVKALDAGADDYLTKPFSLPELQARMRATLRNHARIVDGPAATVGFGPYTLNFGARCLLRGNNRVHLSPTEFRLLATLARRPDRLVAAEVLLKETWGAAYRGKDDYVRVYMHALRRKLETDPSRPEYILNEAGLGYRLNTSVASHERTIPQAL
jgi:two-component system, OmpR family, KDP operon response regulator KdpE